MAVAAATFDSPVLQEWTGTWTAAKQDEVEAFAGSEVCAWLPASFRLRVHQTSATLEGAAADAAQCAAFVVDLDAQLRSTPLPQGGEDCQGSWVEPQCCFCVEAPASAWRVQWRLTATGTLNVSVAALGKADTQVVYSKSSPVGPSPVTWLRRSGKVLATVAERQDALEQVARMTSDGLEEINAAQLKDRVVPPRFDGTAKMLLGACKFYQQLVPAWMEPEKLEDTCPSFLKDGVEADWFVLNEPKGVGVVIVPWNAPVTLACIPALGMLAAGNQVVIKTAELTPTVAAVLRRLFHKYLYGRVWVEEGGKEAVERIIDEGADHLVFTGGGATARIVAARCALHLTPVTLELGGKSPVYIDKGLSDSMLENVIREILETKVAKTGQFCCAHDYALVHDEMHEQFCQQFAAAVEALGEKRNIVMIGRRQYEDVKRKLEEASAVCIPPLGGSYQPNDALMTLPMVGLLQPAADRSVLTTEIFGPLMPILRVSGVEEAIAAVQNNPCGKPLIAYCCTEDQASVEAFLSGVSAGNIAVNGGPQRFHLNFNVGFGGIGPSGTGASMWGREALREFSNRKHVLHARDGFARSFFSGPPAANPPQQQ